MGSPLKQISPYLSGRPFQSQHPVRRSTTMCELSRFFSIWVSVILRRRGSQRPNFDDPTWTARALRCAILGTSAPPDAGHAPGRANVAGASSWSLTGRVERISGGPLDDGRLPATYTRVVPGTSVTPHFRRDAFNRLRSRSWRSRSSTMNGSISLAFTRPFSTWRRTTWIGGATHVGTNCGPCL